VGDFKARYTLIVVALRAHLEIGDAILLILQANKGVIEGRTTIQKLTYLCGLKTRIKEVEDFRPRYYGPFSQNTALALEQLVGLGFIVESPHRTMRDNISYRYGLTEDGKSVATKLARGYRTSFGRISNTVDIARESCGLNPYVLSYAAKVHYIIRQIGKPIDEQRAVTEGKNLKWEITEKDAKAGIKLLLALDLVEEVAA